ncbi:MAG: T9SS C-terminal target domain-containing protein [Bacteroidetes bacterium]|nr:MAG: T9SS C-terminal target domain-containing protein [Bacteroidota bacterium]
MCILNVRAQDCTTNSNGITTNPTAPVNTQKPSKTNTFFDWRTTFFHTRINPNLPTFIDVVSPFWQLDNSITNHFLDNKDFKPSDGWELIRRDFGLNNDITANTPVENPYLILYNRYNSTLRIFVARGVQNNPFNSAILTMGFEGVEGNVRSNLLTLVQGIKPVVEPYAERNLNISAVSKFNNLQYKWFYVDFAMNYDPCTCLYQSKIQINVEFITTSTVNLSGTATGTLTDNGTSAASPSFIKSLGSAGKKALETFKSIDGFTSKYIASANALSGVSASDKASKVSTLTLLGSLLKNSKFLKAGFAEAPFIGGALSLVDYFFGGGKKKEEPQFMRLMPMAINMSIKLTGSITSNFPYNNIVFHTPGTNNNALNPDEYPYYNEVMGVFNVFYTPKVQRYSLREPLPPLMSRNFMITSTYGLADSIQYVVNPAAKVSVQEIKAALIIEGSYMNTPPEGNFNFYEGQNSETGLHQYRTDYVDLGCIKTKEFYQVYTNSPNSPASFKWLPSGKVYLKIMANLKRNDANPSDSTQNILFVAKYPVEMLSRTSPLVQDADNGSCALYPSLAGSRINAFCLSNAYKDSRIFLREHVLAQEAEAKARQPKSHIINISPNPSGSVSKVDYFIAEKQSYTRLSLIDSKGQIIREIDIEDKEAKKKGFYSVDIDLQSLPEGLYFVSLQTSGFRDTKRLMISR